MFEFLEELCAYKISHDEDILWGKIIRLWLGDRKHHYLKSVTWKKEITDGDWGEMKQKKETVVWPDLEEETIGYL